MLGETPQASAISRWLRCKPNRNLRIFPFSFKEFLNHHGHLVPADPNFLAKSEVSSLESAFLNYLSVGGFPEAQGGYWKGIV